MSRIPPIERSDLQLEGQKVWDVIAGLRGVVRGPNQVLIRVPKLAGVVSAVGTYFLTGGLLGDVDRETVTLATAHECAATFEWVVHEPRALKAGVRPDVIETIRSNASTGSLETREQLLIEVTRELVREHRLSDGLYDRTLREFGETHLIELVAMIGFYILLSTILGGFAVE